MAAMRTPPGLEGVIVADTALGGVRGDEGFFHYRQYSAVDLARTRTLEDVWYLLHHGRLPDAAELAGFRKLVGEHRALAPDVAEMVATLAPLGSDIPVLTWVRTAMSLVAQSLGLRSWLGQDAGSCIRSSRQPRCGGRSTRMGADTPEAAEHGA